MATTTYTYSAEIIEVAIQEANHFIRCARDLQRARSAAAKLNATDRVAAASETASRTIRDLYRDVEIS